MSAKENARNEIITKIPTNGNRAISATRVREAMDVILNYAESLSIDGADLSALRTIADSYSKAQVDTQISSAVSNRATTSAMETADQDLQEQIDGKEPTLEAGSPGTYFSNDKSWKALNKAAVGLSNVDNTSDLSKPISTATQTALNAKTSTAQVESMIENAIAALPQTGTERIALNHEIVGVRDGVNRTFFAPSPFMPGSLKVYKEGARMSPGGTYDYVVNDVNTGIICNDPVLDDETFLWEYIQA